MEMEIEVRKKAKRQRFMLSALRELRNDDRAQEETARI
jgi:hypothetical protein